ncbi:MAG: HAD-IIA family hydrolase [Actinomycetota bacterium]
MDRGPVRTVRLAAEYDAFLFDLDGVVHRGDDVIPGAPETVAALRDAGRTVVFITNNSARTPDRIAERLTGMGIRASSDEVVTSALATAALLRREGDEGARSAFVVGEEGIRAALSAVGIEVLDGTASRADYVIVGWDRGADYDALRTATVLVGRGARLVATNGDASYPAPSGELWPGAGALLAAVETASGVRATVVGKPHRPLFDAALERAGTRRALVVGDRIETDVAGAEGAGLDGALVLTGAAVPADLLTHQAQPRFVLPDVRGLLEERPAASVRPATDDDAAGVRALLETAGLGPHDGDLWEEPVSTVVAGDGDLVATAAIEVRAENAYLRAVAVAEAARGYGLGMQIVGAAAGAARHRGASRVWLFTETAWGFFGRLGFETVVREALPPWIAGMSHDCPITMGRSIAGT